MADGTYQPKVYRKQGGDEFVVASGGTLNVEEGGSFTMEAGATFTLPFVAEAEGSTMAATGISSIGGTSAHTWVLAPPTPGAFKIIAVNAASTSSGGAQTIYTGSSGITFDGTNDKFTVEGPIGLTLVGLSTNRWHVVGQQLAIASSSEIAAGVTST